MSRRAGVALTLLLEEATAALAHLNAEELQDLQVRARKLQALANDGVAVAATPETESRFRLFAGATAAAGENLKVLRRGVSYGSERRGPWGR